MTILLSPWHKCRHSTKETILDSYNLKTVKICSFPGYLSNGDNCFADLVLVDEASTSLNATHHGIVNELDNSWRREHIHWPDQDDESGSSYTRASLQKTKKETCPSIEAPSTWSSSQQNMQGSPMQMSPCILLIQSSKIFARIAI
jgi:hypothetical protein